MLKKRNEKLKNKEVKKGQKNKLENTTKGLKLYVGILVVTTLILGFHLIFTLIIYPRSIAGSPIFGNRLDYIEEIPNTVVTSTEEFGFSQSRVENVKIMINGPVVYFDVRVDEEADVATARRSAEAIANFFLNEADEVGSDYNLQLVVSKGDINELRQTNREEVNAHVQAHLLIVYEAITAHAELYPTENNINRIYQNINLWSGSEEEVANFRDRADALEPMTAEEEERLAEVNGGVVPSYNSSESRIIPPSDIADFPSWGTLNKTTGEIDWS